MRADTSGYAVVVPTIGRPSLQALLDALGRQPAPPPDEVVLVDDRGVGSLPVRLPEPLGSRVRVLAGRAAGPAAARNDGWLATATPWVVFLDDDVVPADGWSAALAADLSVGAEVAGSQGRIDVPGPRNRRPTDNERKVAGLADARWATADMAYRRTALAAVGGFDERFPRAFREDADLALRLQHLGYGLVVGKRRTTHPAADSGRWRSVRAQRGNLDDALMRRVHGSRWHDRAGAPVGTRPLHLATTAAGALAAGGCLAGRRRVAGVGALAWLAGTAAFGVPRLLAGPARLGELAEMTVTSALIPPLASAHWLAGRWRHRRAPRWPGPVEAVLFDRDGTLIEDVADIADPELVRPVPTAAEALSRLRQAGVRTGVVTNQSAVAAGRIGRSDVARVNARVEQLLGPLGTWQVCPHAPAGAPTIENELASEPLGGARSGRQGCQCRKPAPGLVDAALASLGVSPLHAAVVGDIGSDIDAATAAGTRSVLVPTAATRDEEERAAPRVAGDLLEAIEGLL
jgi:histidinol-phosphate phosphatase family protein